MQRFFFDIELCKKLEAVADWYEPPLLIGYAVGVDGEYKQLIPEQNGRKWTSWIEILREVIRLGRNRIWAGWNITNFDLPYLRTHCIMCDVKAPSLPGPRDYRLTCDYRFYLGYNNITFQREAELKDDFMRFKQFAKYALAVDPTVAKNSMEQNKLEIEALQELARKIDHLGIKKIH